LLRTHACEGDNSLLVNSRQIEDLLLNDNRLSASQQDQEKRVEFSLRDSRIISLPG